MILQCQRCAEQCHQAVAGEPNGSLITLHHDGRAVEQLVHDFLESLGIQRRRELHRADDVGKQHRHLLVFARRRSWRRRGAAHIAEARLGTQIITARPAPVGGLTDRTNHPLDLSCAVNFPHHRACRGEAALNWETCFDSLQGLVQLHRARGPWEKRCSS